MDELIDLLIKAVYLYIKEKDRASTRTNFWFRSMTTTRLWLCTKNILIEFSPYEAMVLFHKVTVSSLKLPSTTIFRNKVALFVY